MSPVRLSLIGAAVATAATIAAAPMLEAQDRTRWRMHSTYARALPVAGETAHRIGEQVGLITGGAFDIRVFEPGALVPGAACCDAVSQGSIDAACGSPGLNAGQNSACNVFAAVPFGPDAGEMPGMLGAAEPPGAR